MSAVNPAPEPDGLGVPDEAPQVPWWLILIGGVGAAAIAIAAIKKWSDEYRCHVCGIVVQEGDPKCHQCGAEFEWGDDG